MAQGQQDDNEFDETKAARARVRKYAAAHNPSPIADFQRRLSQFFNRFKAFGHREPNTLVSVSKKSSPVPMPADRPSIISIVTALVELRMNLERGAHLKTSTNDPTVAMDVINLATDKVIQLKYFCNFFFKFNSLMNI